MANKKVLMVDRENVVLTTAKKLLARENYDLVLCSEVEEALTIISDKGPFAVVLSDNQLAAMRGTEFLTKIKSLEPDTVRILMAAHHDNQLIEDVVNTSEVFRFLKKPLDYKAVIRAVEEGIEENDRRIQLGAQKAEHEKLSTEKLELESETEQLGTTIQGLKQVKRTLVFGMIALIMVFGVFQGYTSWAKNQKREDTSVQMGSWIKFTDGTARDTETNLMWMVRDFRILERRQPIGWNEANAWVEKINEEKYAGYSDWRLPTIQEFEAIYKEDGKQLAYDQKENFTLGNPDAFESGGGYGFWSNEQIGLKSARYFFFLGGYSKTSLKDYNNPTLSVRLVRN
jgi:FixJ family two-component response regulator